MQSGTGGRQLGGNAKDRTGQVIVCDPLQPDFILFCRLTEHFSKDVGPKDGTCFCRLRLLPLSVWSVRTRREFPSSLPASITGLRPRPEDEQRDAEPGNWGQEGKVYPLDLPEIIQSICPPAQHILALCQLGHQVFEVVLGFCQGPLVGEVAGGTIGVPSPWVQTSILHQLPLTLEEKEKGVFTPYFRRRGRKERNNHLCNPCYVPDAFIISLDPADNAVREALLFPFYQSGN